MTRLNVYVPDALADQARVAGLNVSALTQAAITRELSRHATEAWLANMPTAQPRVSHETALAAVEEARDELGAGA